MNLLIKKWPIVILALSILAVGSAFIAEYVFNILPCKLCLYQRMPYYFIIGFSLVFFLINNISLKLYYWLLEVCIVVGLFYAIWHVGIEKKILPGPSGCTNTFQQSESLNDLKNQILNQAIIVCDEITWTIIGFSAATINSLLLILLLIFNTIFLKEIYNDKETSN